MRSIECVRKLQRDQNNPFFQRFSTGFDVLTTNTSPLDPVSSACVGGPVTLQPSSLVYSHRLAFSPTWLCQEACLSSLPSDLDFLTVDCMAASVLLANCTS